MLTNQAELELELALIMPTISVLDARRILSCHFASSNPELSVVTVKELPNRGLGFTSTTSTWILDLGSDNNATHSSFLTLSDESETPKAGRNSLAVVANTIRLIHAHTSIPISESVLGTISLSKDTYNYLLTPPYPITSTTLVSLSQARSSGLLQAPHLAIIESQIAELLAKLHQGVQNHWFGELCVENVEPKEPSYSWAETFHILFEELLSEIENLDQHWHLPYSELRTYFPRAIGSYAFDDVEVPSLIWVTGSEDDILLSVTPTSMSIAAILPNLPYALWGDPLLESFFLANSFGAAYKSAGGDDLLVFPRQQAKRLWYGVYLGLLVLRETGQESAQKEWAVALVRRNAAALKDASYSSSTMNGTT